MHKWVSVLVVLAGCSKKPAPTLIEQAEAALKEQRSAVTPKVELAEKIAKDPVGPKPGSFQLDGPAFVPISLGGGNKGNWTLIYREDLADMTGTAKRTFDLGNANNGDLTGVMAGCAYLIRKGVPPFSVDDPQTVRSRVKFLVDACAQLNYLVVLDTKSFVATKTDELTKTFMPGKWNGGISVYSLTSGKNLGGFDLEVVQKATTLTGDQVRFDFNVQIREAIVDGLKGNAK